MDRLLASKYLVLSGGGINGLCTVGGLRVLETCLGAGITLRDHFEGFAGSSVGSLISLYLVCGVALDILIEDFDRVRGALTNMSMSWNNFATLKGGCSDYSPLDSMITKVLPRAGVTFQELFICTNKHLLVVAMDMSSLRLQYFDHTRTPDVAVVQAILASMAIPTIYPPVRIGAGLYVDGGLCMNFPFCVFPKKDSFGLWLQHKQRNTTDPDNILSCTMTFFKSMALSLFYSQDLLLNEMLLPDYRDHIVIIPTPFAIPLPGSEVQIDAISMQRQGFMATWLHLHHFGECPDEQVLEMGLAMGLLRPPIHQWVVYRTHAVFCSRVLLETLLQETIRYLIKRCL